MRRQTHTHEGMASFSSLHDENQHWQISLLKINDRKIAWACHNHQTLCFRTRSCFAADIFLKLYKKNALSPHSCLHHLLRLHIFESWEHYDVIILHDNKKANLEYDFVGNSSLTNVFINWWQFKHMCIFVDFPPFSHLHLTQVFSRQGIFSECMSN